MKFTECTPNGHQGQPNSHLPGWRFALKIRSLGKTFARIPAAVFHRVLCREPGREYFADFAYLTESGSCLLEDELGRATVEDRRKKFEAFVLPHLDILYRAAVRLVGQRADAEDLVQESCLRAFAGIDRLREVESCKAWLFTIMRSSYLRRWGEDPYRARVVGVENLEATLADMKDVLHDPYEIDPPYLHVVGLEIQNAITALPLTFREAVVLADVARLSYREMARILEIPLGTVMSRLYRGRRMLRATLRDYGSERRLKQRSL